MRWIGTRGPIAHCQDIVNGNHLVAGAIGWYIVIDQAGLDSVVQEVDLIFQVEFRDIQSGALRCGCDAFDK